jgi:hypothetical protein
VLTRAGRFAFIPDDLGYSFIEQLDRNPDRIVRLGDFSDPLRELGWRDIELCPACKSHKLAGRYDRATEQKVECAYFDEHDFEPTNNGWRLTNAGHAKELCA